MLSSSFKREGGAGQADRECVSVQQFVVLYVQQAVIFAIMASRSKYSIGSCQHVITLEV